MADTRGLRRVGSGRRDGGPDDGSFDFLAGAAEETNAVMEHVREAAAVPGLGMEVAESLRDLSLTLATLDRTLLGFINVVLQQGGHTPVGTVGLAGQGKLMDAVERMKMATPDLERRVPSGGIVSLLYHFMSVLDMTRQALVLLREERRGYLRSFSTFLTRVVLPVVCGSMFHNWRAIRVRGTRRRVLSTAVAYMVLRLVRYVSWSLSAKRQLRVCNAQLQLLLRIWLICVEVFTAANIKRDKSYATLVPSAVSDDYDDSLKPAARIILEQMSLPAGAAIWFKHDFRLGLLKYALDTVYSGMHVGYRMKDTMWWWLRWPASLTAMCYYAWRPALAAEVTARLLQSPSMKDDCNFVVDVWGVIDSPIARFVSLLFLPRVRTSRNVTIEGVNCHIFYNERLPGSFFASRKRFGAHAGLRARAADAKTKVGGRRGKGGRVSASEPEPADLPIEALLRRHGPYVDPRGGAFSPKESPPSSSASTGAPASVAPACLLYLHGGGFVGSSFANDARMLARWAQRHKMMIVFVHYSLAPEHRYPVALDQVVRVYAWLRMHCPRVVVFGESAGGNLAAALTLRCIDGGLPVPDGMVLGYPAVNLNSSPSPSRAMHLNDPLIPVALLIGLANAYLPEHLANKPVSDKYLCPAYATDEDLRRFPPTYLFGGGCDPLLDDAIDFNTRLRRQGIEGELKVYRALPHGFISFQHILSGSESADAIDHARRAVATLLNVA